MTIPTATPSSQGVRAAGLLALVEAFDAHPTIEPHGLIVQRHGHRVLEASWSPHTTERSRLVYSLSKTFTGTALAFALDEGLLGLDDLVADHLPEAAIGADERVLRMKVRHIASMSSGHDREMLLDALVADPEDPIRGFLSLRPEHEPGTWFAYNQPTTLALATILSKVTGMGLVDYLRPRVLDPLGITDLSWTESRPGVVLGFAGVFTTLDAVARLGQLHLDDGRWDGGQLLPAGWVADAARLHIDNPREPEVDWRQGYGFQLWMSRHGYRGDGAYGQLMVVLPEHDTVVAMFAHAEDMQGELDAIWEHLLPALEDAPIDPGTAPVPDDEARLAERVAGLHHPTALERTGGVDAPAPTGTFTPGDPEPLGHTSIESIDVDGGELVLHERKASLRVPLGATWAETTDPPVAASAARLPSGAHIVDLVFLATPHRLVVTLDPATSTFTATWPAFPLFGGGIGPKLTQMSPPA